MNIKMRSTEMRNKMRGRAFWRQAAVCLIAATLGTGCAGTAAYPKWTAPDVPQSVLDVRVPGEPIGDTLTTTAKEVEGYDDVFVHEDEGIAYLTGRDGWIWKVDIASGKAKQLVDVPVMAAGIHATPDDKNLVVITCSRRGGGKYPEGERVGLYTLHLKTLKITPLVTRVPHSADVTEPTVFATADQDRVRVDSLDDSNSRLLAVCNDASVSADGKRIYFTESYVADAASMGGIATLSTIINLGYTGRLWMYNADDQTVGLVANGYTFTDGILVEGDGRGPETTVLLTDNPRYEIHRLHLAGARAGESEVIWEGLPGLVDGMRRDAKGRIWVTIISTRGHQLPWIYANPEVKPLLLEHPQLLSIPSVTALLLLSPDASTPLWYAEHNQTGVTAIAAVTPCKAGLYLANFSDKTPGLHLMKHPLK
jgi:sugar lactone lactonase YvrE